MNLIKNTFTTFFLLLLLSSFHHLAWSNNLKEIKVGVLAKRGPDKALQKWNPTATFLNNHLPGYKFRIVPMLFDEIPLLIDKQLVDFVIVNSGIFVDLSVRFGLRRVLTLKNRLSSGLQSTEFGSVIFTRTDNTELWKLDDIKHKQLAAVHPTSLGGWIMALYEINNHGISENDFARLSFLGTHDSVVEAILEKRADVGVVRTDTLERMASEGKLDLTQLRILYEKKHSGFPLKISTQLYPEWPLAKLQHTSSTLAKSVAIALMQMPNNSEAANAANIEGWTIPENYQPVHEILRQLQLPPYEEYGNLILTKILTTYWYWVMIILIVVLLQSGLLATIFKLNKKLRNQQQNLIQNEELFKATFDQAAVGFLHASPNGKLLKVNRKLCETLGYSETEILKFNFNDFTDPADISDVLQQLDRMRQNEINHFTYQKKYKCKNGSFIWGLTTVSCIRENNGNIKYLLIVLDDVSESKLLELKIQQHQKQNKLILDIAGDGILGLDAKGFHTFVNPAAAKLFGWEIEEMIGKNSHSMWHHSHASGQPFAETECPITQVLRKGQTHRGKNEIMWHKDGSSFHAEYISTPIIEGDDITGAVVVVRRAPTPTTPNIQ